MSGPMLMETECGQLPDDDQSRAAHTAPIGLAFSIARLATSMAIHISMTGHGIPWFEGPC